MSYQEIADKYKEIFIMLVEKAGRETGNTSYLKVSEILEQENNKTMFSGLVEREAGMEVLVCSLVVSLFFDIYGLDKLSDWNDEDGYEKLTEFYRMFLKKPTIKFCEKYGLEPFEDPNTAFKVVKYERDKNDRDSGCDCCG
jgi:hypothetical protein